MKKLSTFQIVVTAGFIIFTILGVLLFAGVGGFGGREDKVGPVVVWGTYDEKIMKDVLRELSYDDNRFDEVSYVEKDARTFDTQLVEALAAGSGPDLFFLQQDTIVRHKDKIYPIPYSVVSERAFRDSFIEEGELFLGQQGIYAMPFMVDPMVLYWNRDHYARAGIARPPRYWDELLGYAGDGVLTLRGESGAILQSAFAIGGYRNITHAKELLSLLMLQAGTPIVDDQAVEPTAQLRSYSVEGVTPAENALRFYTDFANPSKSIYTWNSALPEAQKAFVSGILSNYAGFAGELSSIRKQNPNLNFDVALIPQVRESGRTTTFGKMTALAVPKGAQNLGGGIAIALALSEDVSLQKVVDMTGFAPVSRALLATRPTDPFKAVLWDAALQSGAWLDPSAEATEGVFQRMIESVVSGRLRISEAVDTAHRELENLLQ
ncbi:MAG: extracellular solute-binding protein [Candidatus Pacebacteria bacterium]|nr:extracellular solute-binding protein [Candidatus Paceibacterota bacterium]